MQAKAPATPSEPVTLHAAPAKAVAPEPSAHAHPVAGHASGHPSITLFAHPHAAAATSADCDVPGDGCGIGDLFHLLGRVHMLDLLHQFIRGAPGPRRFVDLQQTLGISPNTLSERLKALVEAGLLSRTAYNEIPPRVDYEATPKAHELRPVFEALWAWSRRHGLGPGPLLRQAPAP